MTHVNVDTDHHHLVAVPLVVSSLTHAPLRRLSLSSRLAAINEALTGAARIEEVDQVHNEVSRLGIALRAVAREQACVLRRQLPTAGGDVAGADERGCLLMRAVPLLTIVTQLLSMKHSIISFVSILFCSILFCFLFFILMHAHSFDDRSPPAVVALRSYQKSREHTHRDTIESTNARVLWWSTLEVRSGRRPRLTSSASSWSPAACSVVVRLLLSLLCLFFVSFFDLLVYDNNR